MKKNTIRFLAVLGVAVLVWQVLPASSPRTSAPVVSGVAVAAAAARPARGDTAVVRFAVAGMTCGSCATTAHVVLDKVDGVYRSHVSYDSASAVVWYDPRRVAPPAMVTALREMTGYEATVAAGGSE